jgi:hypothetical protein
MSQKLLSRPGKRRDKEQRARLAQLDADLEAQVLRMQTPKSREGIRALFTATPAQLGQAAIKAAQGADDGARISAARRAELNRAGWWVGSTEELLGLTVVEATLINNRLALADVLKKRRVELALTRTKFARRLKTTPSQIAALEAAASDVSLETLVRAVLATGATGQEIATAFTKALRT